VLAGRVPELMSCAMGSEIWKYRGTGEERSSVMSGT